MYLVRAPVPCGQYGEAQSHAGPGQVSSDSISKQMHGVLTWEVAGTVGNDLTRHCIAVHMLQVAKTTNLVKSCRPGTQNSHNCVIPAVAMCVFLKFENWTNQWLLGWLLLLSWQMFAECQYRWRQQDRLKRSWKTLTIRTLNSSLSLIHDISFSSVWLFVHLQWCIEPWPPAWGQWTGTGSSPDTPEWTRLQSTGQSSDGNTTHLWANPVKVQHEAWCCTMMERS